MWRAPLPPLLEQGGVVHPRLLLFFLLEHGCVEDARRRYDDVMRIYRRVGPPTPQDAARIGEGLPCIVPLLDAQGRCARTLQEERPIIVQLGVCLSGPSGDGWIRQFCLAQDLLAPSIHEDEVPNPVVVIDAGVPSTMWVSPGYVRFLCAQPSHAHVHVCGLSPAAKVFADVILSPLPSHLVRRVTLHAGYEVLSTLLRPEDLPVRWGGPSQAFDLDAYGERVRGTLFGPTSMPWWDSLRRQDLP